MDPAGAYSTPRPLAVYSFALSALITRFARQPRFARILPPPPLILIMLRPCYCTMQCIVSIAELALFRMLIKQKRIRVCGEKKCDCVSRSRDQYLINGKFPNFISKIREQKIKFQYFLLNPF